MSDLEKQVQDYLCYLRDQFPKVSGVEWGNAYYELTKFLTWVKSEHWRYVL